MFKYFLFFVLISVAFAHFTYLSDDEEFELFKKKFDRHYSSPLEEKLRKQIFIDTLREIKEHNARYEKGLVSWYKGINQFSDWTDEEFEKIQGLKTPPPREYYY
ncbi:unnamed protein product [Diabrotica balteata]|uniref:Cathepsin propeptide inhibitor domain-containing protein n=1 Tax=Diabrotica balteata TaxID=107213 RepID=A0A9N9TD25_DIABA|nr:unnamed protein product [Diabrotica balteata]